MNGKVSIRGMDELLRGVSNLQRSGPAVLQRTLNKTAPGMKTEAGRLLVRELTLKSREIGSRIAVIRAGSKRLRAGIRVRSKRGLPLILFKTSPTRPTKRKPAKGVAVQIKQRGATKVIEGSFVAKMKSGHVGVFSRPRKEAPRLPVFELYGISVIPYLERGNLRRMLLKRSRARLVTNFRRELRFELHRNIRRLEGLST